MPALTCANRLGDPVPRSSLSSSLQDERTLSQPVLLRRSLLLFPRNKGIEPSKVNRRRVVRANSGSGSTPEGSGSKESRDRKQAKNAQRQLSGAAARIGRDGAAMALAVSLQLSPLDAPPDTFTGYRDSELALPALPAERGVHWLTSLSQHVRTAHLIGPAPALANGLLQMPPLKLNNEYYLVRAGESQWEAIGVLHTNPVDKTNVQSGLSERGKKQAVAAGRELEKLGACNSECWLWPSISQRSYQTAEVIAYLNDLSYSRIVPEYSFLDARGVGAWENQPMSSMEELYELDSADMRIRPPKTTDGTPSESAHDVFVRVRQMMSVIETQYQGDSIVIVSPDSDNLSVLQAALTGLDLRSHHLLRFAPGEVRRVGIPEDLQREPLISGVVKI